MDQNGVIFGRVVIQNSVQHLVLHFDESEGLVHAFSSLPATMATTSPTKRTWRSMSRRSRGLASGNVWPAWVYREASCGTSSQVKIASMPGTFLATAVLTVLTIALALGRAEQFDDEAVGRNEIVHVNWLARYQLHGIFFAVCFADGFHSAASCFCFFQARKFKIPRSWPS